ncbi:hypothetical protein [Hymenobacter cellulosivorans]|uniref:Uncharacterized protein n=1 Tax=Hymenobacter cellulosivorans TaxID=2932249 RepID=A0ABY4FHQ7_9BACT|nr:hypothetical protein [Hymenobacter cellulosivorans]UOQ55548.1 hypothetical protein MUN80_12490 [Hymenobacter cellulosivorans]
MNERTIDVSGYGLFCLSIEAFTFFLRKHKIRTKKLNNFLDKNRHLLEEAMREGYLLPIATINSIGYIIDLGETDEIEVFSSGWQEVLALDNCNMMVGSDAAVWVGSLDSLDAWNSKEYEGRANRSYQTLDGETLYSAQKFNVYPAKYKVRIVGFKRKRALPYPVANFGFAFSLTETESFDTFTNPLVEDVNIAKM